MIYIVVLFFLFITISIYKKYIEMINQNKPIFKKLRTDLRKIYPNIDSIKFYESFNGNYTKNKVDIHLELICNYNNLMHYNSLMYIALHELAHCLTEDIGHTEKFYLMHDKILKAAITEKIYDPRFPLDREYCKI